jgi:magnesium transporter
MESIRAFAEKYQLHPLAIEDMLIASHQPKLEDYPGSDELPGRLFIVGRMVTMDGDALSSEQVSLFLGRSTLLSFQDSTSTVFESIYHRIELPGSRLRTHDVSFLLHAIIDAIVDSYFPALENYAECLEVLDDELRDRPAPNTLQRIHVVKRNLVLLRRSIWPMRELIAQLQRDKHECLSETTQTYFRDIYDHCAQIIDLLETYREIAAALTETYMAVVSNRMNEIMKVLTVISTIFIPLTFLAGVYGMNMPLPGGEWIWSYPLFWAICIVCAGAMLVLFRRRGWL